MNVTILPSVAKGTVTAPPSKSMAHRALICAALAGNSHLSGLAFSQDIFATINCLNALGAEINLCDSNASIDKINLYEIPQHPVLPCNESGSTLRFLLPLCMCAGKSITLCGTPRLFERPLTVYEQIAKEQNISFIKTTDSVTVCGKLKSGNYTVAGNLSSQFISGLLFVLPLLCGDSTLTVTGKFESESYVDLTLYMLNLFGIEINRKQNTFYIKGSQQYTKNDYLVEGDCSNAAFLEAFNFLGGNVTVGGLNPNTLQGDRVYIDIFSKMKAGKACFDLCDCPDLAPVCFALAAVLGKVSFTGTARLKIKESDRADAMRQELAKFGVSVDIYDNSVTVWGGALKKPQDILYSHNDHRIAMALSLLCTLTGGTISCAQAVSKSYPDFFDVLKFLKIGLNTDATTS